MTDNQVNTSASKEIKAVSLIDGKFTPSQAADILNVMIDKKINFHKLQVLSRVEGNELDQCTFDKDRLTDLQNNKIRLNEIIKDARANGLKLKLSSTISIELVSE